MEIWTRLEFRLTHIDNYIHGQTATQASFRVLTATVLIETQDYLPANLPLSQTFRPEIVYALPRRKKETSSITRGKITRQAHTPFANVTSFANSPIRVNADLSARRTPSTKLMNKTSTPKDIGCFLQMYNIMLCERSVYLVHFQRIGTE
ncbi:hypothetical protein FIBSPDRAFT_902067 [Athelia psychrophila]|uniref:Uncharacterized protein n=1 Tax=Athelia psychrophila TaxID=1759441 RepID=A0A167XPF6_9AGAM|nr:hypothetical protein FIBSPDRAFT_902067 [Fibularhizoctonia sp. CBS 109695]